MKKILALILALSLVFALAACSDNSSSEDGATTDTDVKGEGVMTYEEYDAADLDTEVTIEAYIQAAQVYAAEYGNTTLYLQDDDGAYFVYRVNCTQDEYNEFTVGQKIKVTGYKSEWSGEIEITDAEVEILDGTKTYAAKDLTDSVGSDLIGYQNQFVSFAGMTVEDYGDGNAFAYKNPDEKNGDLYFKVSKDGTSYEFCVETDLTEEGSDVYTAVEGLNIGDTVDLEGFLYWYEGPNLQTTSVTVK